MHHSISVLTFSIALVCLTGLSNAYALPHWSLQTRQANETTKIDSSTWTKCRQPVPCAANANLTSKYDVDACAAVAARWSVGDETVETYQAIGPYIVNDLTISRISNLGTGNIQFSRKDLAAAITRLSAECVKDSPAHNSIVCDADIENGSLHIEIMGYGAGNQIAPATATTSAGNATATNDISGGSSSGNSTATSSSGASISSGVSSSGSPGGSGTASGVSGTASATAGSGSSITGGANSSSRSSGSVSSAESSDSIVNKGVSNGGTGVNTGVAGTSTSNSIGGSSSNPSFSSSTSGQLTTQTAGGAAASQSVSSNSAGGNSRARR